MNGQSNIILPEPTLRRLPWYLAYVDTLQQRGVATVSSTQISKALNVDASQIAKDLSHLNLKGKTRIGYDVPLMRRVLADFLGFETLHPAFVIGVGSLGTALIRDKGLANYGLRITHAFDVNPGIIGTDIDGVPVMDVKRINEINRLSPASIAIITVPAEKAQDAADLAIAANIRALWNFTPYRVAVPEGIVMSSTSIYANLALIYNRLSAASGIS